MSKPIETVERFLTRLAAGEIDTAVDLLAPPSRSTTTRSPPPATRS
ncbi:MAG TPA: hypothetical protein VGO13_10900 [Solirubrobacterales bacterium]|jgi:hypothetical protein|nr:hypothetical protein [Solirubrobacterales bacterium]